MTQANELSTLRLQAAETAFARYEFGVDIAEYSLDTSDALDLVFNAVATEGQHLVFHVRFAEDSATVIEAYCLSRETGMDIGHDPEPGAGYAMSSDFGLTAKQLREKYTTGEGWGRHPHFVVSDWQYEVDNNDTRLGYWDWVCNQLEIEQMDAVQTVTEPAKPAFTQELGFSLTVAVPEGIDREAIEQALAALGAKVTLTDVFEGKLASAEGLTLESLVMHDVITGAFLWATMMPADVEDAEFATGDPVQSKRLDQLRKEGVVVGVGTVSHNEDLTEADIKAMIGGTGMAYDLERLNIEFDEYADNSNQLWLRIRHNIVA